MKSLLALSFLCFSLFVQAQYPSQSVLLGDVKKQSPDEFVTITPVGSWSMFHDKVPDWQTPDACRHQVDIVGKKNADGSFWTYSGLAIYAKAGNAFVFDRLFLIEDATRLNGLAIPDRDYFKELFMEKLAARDPMLLLMNYELKNATAFYGFEMKAEPKISGSGSNLSASYLVEVVLDLPNGNRLEQKRVPVEVKAAKSGNGFVFTQALKKSDGELMGIREMGSSEAVEELPRYGFDEGSLADFTRTEQSYAVPAGSNGEGMPTDQNLVALMEKTFLGNPDNFAVLFGPKGAALITSVTFDKKATRGAETDKLTAVFEVEYVFFNEKPEEQQFKMITAVRELETSFVKENGTWYVDQSAYLNEAVYTKTEDIAWPYRNSYKEKAFDRTRFKQ
jgi:hypothetical protein